ncbi:MAG: ABC transporter ATP-binding protein [Roseburia sp.]|nr:ABC transporter ATP-binding protein [Roseburia sp.]
MLKLFKHFTKREWLGMGVIFVLAILQTWLSMTMPEYMSEITRLVQTEGSVMGDILAAGGKMLLCALGTLATAALTVVCTAQVSAGLSANLRSAIFNKVQSFSMQEIGKFSTASLLTRTTNDVMQVQMLLVMGTEILFKAPMTAIWAIVKIAGKSWQWTTVTAVAVVILLMIVSFCLALTLPKFKKMQKLTDNLNRVTRENLTGLQVIRAYNAEAYQEEKFEKANEELKSAQLYTGRVMGFMAPGIQAVMNGLSLAVYWIGAYLIENAAMTEKLNLFSEMVVFSQYALQVVMAFMMLVMISVLLPRALVSAKRINEVLDTPLSVPEGIGRTSAPGREGEIEFKDVSFRYADEGKNVLSHISFAAKKGETVALIGTTGCGKSTVVNLIPRFYDATEGEVLVDGVNVKEYTQEDLRNKIGYVSQKAILFSGTIADNVAYGENGGKGFTEENIKNALHIAQADEFVEQKTDGYEGYVAQGGANFSGGQKQRLSIARAVCRDPEILIFDDSFSALDYKTDRILRKELDDACRDVTRVIVAQRIGTIRDADKIIVLEDGCVAGMGTHEELMNHCEAYRQIAYSQLSKEELA